MIHPDNLALDVREINRIVKAGTNDMQYQALYVQGIYGTWSHHRPVRIIGARIKGGVMQVHIRKTGRWIDVDPDLDHFILNTCDKGDYV